MAHVVLMHSYHSGICIFVHNGKYMHIHRFKHNRTLSHYIVWFSFRHPQSLVVGGAVYKMKDSENLRKTVALESAEILLGIASLLVWSVTDMID